MPRPFPYFNSVHVSQLDRIESKLDWLISFSHTEGHTIMAAIDDLNAKIDEVAAKIETVGGQRSKRHSRRCYRCFGCQASGPQ